MHRVNQQRIRILRDSASRPGPVAYWMSRDQRVEDNWALLYAQQVAFVRKGPLLVVFCLVPDFLNATVRQYGFMLAGLRELEADLHEKNIPFFLVSGSPEHLIPQFVNDYHVGTLITDFDPLKVKRLWKERVVNSIHIPCYEVDAHNIIPCWAASPKQEFAARTFRPKARRALTEFLTNYPKLNRHPFPWNEAAPGIDWQYVERSLKVDTKVSKIGWLTPGQKAARKRLHYFLSHKLARYDEMRNDPNLDGQSGLSPYLHFGHLSAQRAALEVQKSAVDPTTKEAFLEELVVRRELSDNFCFYNRNYDMINGFPSWAQATLKEHSGDVRRYIYSPEEFERAETHDDLWNAAQMEMVKAGKMHGYMRMYWAKKILEWTETPADALWTAIYLNDRYELDGRDPNGYVGCAWSIGGVHDRAWSTRPVFGKIRYMSYKGCRSKFDVDEYIQRVESI